MPFATSRSEKNSEKYISRIRPDILICSGGAVVKYREQYVLVSDFSVEETRGMISTVREICGDQTEITVDTIDDHFWNYTSKPTMYGKDWGESTYSDFNRFSEKALKMCVNISDEKLAESLSQNLPECSCVRFSDGNWYKFARRTATKEFAIRFFCEKSDISLDEVIAFGDDWADIRMLQLCGMGIAVENAIPEVLEVADRVIRNNDEDGVASFLFHELLGV